MSMASLPPDLEQFVRDQLATGKYQTSADVLCDAVRLMRDRDERLKSLRNEIDRGIKQLESGDFIELDSEEAVQRFFDDIETRGQQKIARGTLTNEDVSNLVSCAIGPRRYLRIHRT